MERFSSEWRDTVKNSDFQFTDPQLLSLTFDTHEEYDLEDEYEIGLIETTVAIKGNEAEENQSVVELKLIIGGKEKPSPFSITIQMGAVFRWNNEITDEQVEKMLKLNAPALLLAYCRPIVSNITAASPFPTFNIPFINFLDS